MLLAEDIHNLAVAVRVAGVVDKSAHTNENKANHCFGFGMFIPYPASEFFHSGS